MTPCHRTLDRPLDYPLDRVRIGAARCALKFPVQQGITGNSGAPARGGEIPCSAGNYREFAAARPSRVFRAVALAGAVLAAPAITGAATAQEREVDLELVLAADISGSMDHEEATLQRQGFVEALRHPEVLEAILGGPLGRIAVTYVEWAGDQHQRTLVDWTEISDAASAAAFAAAVERPAVTTAMWTSISTVIAYGARRFDGNGYRAPRRVIDISGDGPNNRGEYVVHARDRAVADGIVINGLPIINGRPGPYGLRPLPDLDWYYEDCVIGGFGAFVVVANGFADFARAIRRKMLLEIAGRAPPARLLRLAADGARPPCNAGELQLRGWMDDDR